MPYLFSAFFYYSFLGFLIEVLFLQITRGTKRDRKCFFFLPLCPVYGFGALAILSLPPSILQQPLLCLLIGGLSATAVEYITALFYERCLGVSFWNYDALPGNISGRICLLFTFFWGCLSLGLVYWVNPFLSPLISSTPTPILLALYLIFSLDSIYTILILKNSGTTDSLKWYDSNWNYGLKKGQGNLFQR